MTYAAVVLSGLGGLLFELVMVRRYGLLLGNTSEASSLVIGGYLLGLGLGGLLVSRILRTDLRPLRWAASLYAAVAVTALALDRLLIALPPLPFGAGLLLLLATPGIPTVLMGAAFPLVFAALGEDAGSWRVGGLMAANLAGSLLATALGGTLWIPEYGLQATALLASLAYLAAAGMLLVPTPTARRRRSERLDAATDLPALGFLATAAALSGGLVVGLQLLLLRRLPFYLEGFEPTLSGVLAAVLLALTLGSAFGTPLLARAFGERALPVSLMLAALCLSLGLHEHAVGPLARRPFSTEFGMHARIWLCAVVAAGPACFFLGAILPLCVARFGDPGIRSALAGRLFFWQGIGSITGSLLVGQLLPLAWGEGFFVLTPLALALIALACLARRLPRTLVASTVVGVALASLLGWSGAGTLLEPDPPLLGPRADGRSPLEFLGHRTDSTVTASVAYDRRKHSLVLYTNEFRAAETGPFADYMQLLGHLPFLLGGDLDELAVIAFGTGTTARSVTQWKSPKRIHLVEISPAVFSLAGHFAGDAPLAEPRTPAFLRDARTSVHLTDGRRYLALREPASLDLVTMEPLLPYSPGTASLYTREFYELALRTLTDHGLLVQWVPTHAVLPDHYESLLATFARSFPSHSVWFLDGATILVGSRKPHIPELPVLERNLSAAGRAARVGLHEAHVASLEDLIAAFVGDDLLAVVADAPDVIDDRPFVERVGVWKYDGRQRFFYDPNIRVLEELAGQVGGSPLASSAWSQMRARRIRAYRRLLDATRRRDPLRSAGEAGELLALAREILPRSVLLYHEQILASRFETKLVLAQRGGRGVADVVIRQLTRDPGSALLQAARALPALRAHRDGHGLSRGEAAARARAIAPYFFLSPPRFLASIAPPEPGRSPLEDIEILPEGVQLADLTRGDDPLAIALRAAYRVRAGLAWIGVLAERPLTGRERKALSPLLDPILFERAAQAIAARGGSPQTELAPLARPELPLPSLAAFRAPDS